jgi:hypothetical protein
MIELLLIAMAMLHNNTILDQTPHVEMDVYPETLSFCYIHYKQLERERVPFIICNTVDMSKEKLETVRDHLEEYAEQK